MKEDYFKNWTSLMMEMHKPFQSMMELNLKTMQRLSSFKPVSFQNWDQPQQLMEHMKIVVENSQRMFEIMNRSFEVFEKAFVSMAKETSMAEGRVHTPSHDAKKKPADVKKKSAKASSIKVTPQSKTAKASNKKTTPVKDLKNPSLQSKSLQDKKSKLTKSTAKISKNKPSSPALKSKKITKSNQKAPLVNNFEAAKASLSHPPAGAIAISAKEMKKPAENYLMPEKKQVIPRKPEELLKGHEKIHPKIK